jgi:uncharacterized membrane protein
MADGAEGIPENAAGLLCYVFGWVSGLVFFLIDKRPFVRFHAAQSMVVFGGLNILYIILGHAPIGSLTGLMIEAAGLLGMVLWILLMVKAYQGVRYKVPAAGDIAENIASR